MGGEDQGLGTQLPAGAQGCCRVQLNVAGAVLGSASPCAHSLQRPHPCPGDSLPQGNGAQLSAPTLFLPFALEPRCVASC